MKKKPDDSAALQRDEFLALLAHELSNPLAAITFSLDHLREQESLSDSAMVVFDIITRQTSHLSRLVQNMLAVAATNQEHLELNWEDIQLNQLVEDVLPTIAPAIANKKQQLSVSLSPAPIATRADRVRLNQAVINLLDNASKYTPAGETIWLETKLSGNQIEIIVRDSGCGMDEETLQNIFGLFYQANQPSNRKAGGLGIGLYLAQQIIAAHGGSLTATSLGDSQGSIFTITLPV